MASAGTPSGAEPVTTVVFRTVRAGREEDFEEAARAANRTVTGAVGHRGVDVLAPPPGQRLYTVLLRFDSVENMRRWQESPEFAALLDAMAPLCEPQRETHALTGMEGWISVPGRAPPPRWKSVVVSFLAAYPTIAVLQAVVLPRFDFLPSFAQGVLLGLLMCIALTYAVMPLVSGALAKWLYPA